MKRELRSWKTKLLTMLNLKFKPLKRIFVIHSAQAFIAMDRLTLFLFLDAALI